MPAATGLLLQNHPNPFNPRTTIRFRTGSDGPARLAVYSARGERVRVLLDGFVRGGIEHDVIWNGRDETGRMQASGVYYCRLEAGGVNEMNKMVLLR